MSWPLVCPQHKPGFQLEQALSRRRKCTTGLSELDVQLDGRRFSSLPVAWHPAGACAAPRGRLLGGWEVGRSERQAGENLLDERDSSERIPLESGRARMQREAYSVFLFLGGKKQSFVFIIQSAESKAISIRPLSGRIADNRVWGSIPRRGTLKSYQDPA